jgi:hypothetical protein
MRHLPLLLSALVLAGISAPATTSPSSTAPTGAGHEPIQRPPTLDARAPSGQNGIATSTHGTDDQGPSERGAVGRIPPSAFSTKADLLDIWSGTASGTRA